MLRALDDRERSVVETIRMRLPEKLALAHIKGSGFKMSAATWYREKNRLKQNQLQRLHYIAAVGFEEQHLERIDQLELIQKEMWLNYYRCTDPYKKTIILEKIANVQPFLSQCYDATKEIVNNGNKKSYNNNVSKPGSEEQQE